MTIRCTVCGDDFKAWTDGENMCGICRALVEDERQQAHKEMRQMAAEELDKERDDIATRAMYLALIACQQVGLSARTLRRIRDAIPMVTDRYADYKTDGLADAGAKMMLDRSGVDVPETKEKL